MLEHGYVNDNIFPENWWLEDEISFWNGPILGDMGQFSARISNLQDP